MSAPDQPLPEVTASRRGYEGRVNVRLDSLRYAGGDERDHTVVEHADGVTLLPIDAQGRVLLVRQYRHATGKVLLELPAGSIDAGESPEVCAERELQEETGYRPRKMESLGGFYSAPGYSTEYLYGYLCTELVESSLQGDEDWIDVEAVPLDEVLRLIVAGEIEDAKTAAAIMHYLARDGRKMRVPPLVS